MNAKHTQDDPARQQLVDKVMAVFHTIPNVDQQTAFAAVMMGRGGPGYGANKAKLQHHDFAIALNVPQDEFDLRMQNLREGNLQWDDDHEYWSGQEIPKDALTPEAFAAKCVSAGFVVPGRFGRK